MSFFHDLFNPEGLKHLVVEGGYIALAAIIFAENGLLVGFFLPGDSLLITAGILIGSGAVELHFGWLAALLVASAIAGEGVGYFIGKKTGERLYSRPDSRLFKREHLMRTHAFYEKHGGKTIVFARFIPIVRTFVPVVAGAAQMSFRRFMLFNIIGGVVWILAGLLLGLWLGRTVSNIGDYLYLVIGVVIVLSALPPVIEWLRARGRARERLAKMKE
ncbi:MAG: VTT domain-containing protein [Bacteroidota bacterium]|nr:VTT domain-containing protein [Bacteroidota bacterium]MDP4233124.1 VTT domain-containing protein [Bacteroidota bacterium]MDP4241731.1 VTT domain-containing protein [Bacteroidota bacterium]MDP4287389.1 VTT domain-containing protein [Bacteroidota bacterium]